MHGAAVTVKNPSEDAGPERGQSPSACGPRASEEECRANPSEGSLVEDWSQHLQAVRGLSSSTIAAYTKAIEDMAAREGLDRPEDASPEELDHYLRGIYFRGLSKASIRMSIAAFRSYWEYLALRGRVETSPARHLRYPKERRREPDVLTVQEVSKLLHRGRPGTLSADPVEARNQTLLAVAYLCGLRRTEPGRLRLADVGWDEKEEVYSILIREAKWALEDVRMEIHDPVVSRMLGAYLSTTRPQLTRSEWLFPSAQSTIALHGRTVSRIWYDATAEVELQKKGRTLGFHILRRSLATHLFDAGWPPKAVARQLRHASINTTMRYVRGSDEQLRRMWKKRHPLAGKRRSTPDLQRAARHLLADLPAALGTSEW